MPSPTDWASTRHGLQPLRHLDAAARDRGLADVLADPALGLPDLAGADVEVDLRTHVAAVRAVLAHGVDPTTLGLEVGSRANLTQLGLFGFAAMASATLRELLDVSRRYVALTSLALAVEVDEDGGGDGLCTVSLLADHLPADVAPYFAARDLAGLAAVVPMFLSSVFVEHRDRVQVVLAPGEEPLAVLAAPLPVGSVVVGAGPGRHIRFPREVLDAALPQADRGTQELCLAQCEALLRSRSARTGPAAEVRSLLLADMTSPPTLEEVAARLHVHPRTLRRRLATDGTTYRDLLTEVRRELAVELLAEVGLSVEQTARRLGYTETTSFSHAFTRWFGVPPSRWAADGDPPPAQGQAGSRPGSSTSTTVPAP